MNYSNGYAPAQAINGFVPVTNMNPQYPHYDGKFS